MNWIDIFVLVLVIVQIASALFAIIQKDLLLAIIGSSLVSLVLTVFFYLLHAPDVALTEAAIGVALTGIIFVVTIRKTRRFEE